MGNLVVKGKIFSGKGEGREYVRLSWVKEQIIKKIGFTPYEGTLNILLPKNGAIIQRLRNAKGIEIVPDLGFFAGKLFRASIRNLECAVVIPQTLDYPEDVLEVVAAENLRRKLHVRNGDVIKLIVVLQ